IARLHEVEKTRTTELRAKEAELGRRAAELRARSAEIEQARTLRYALAGGLGVMPFGKSLLRDSEVKRSFVRFVFAQTWPAADGLTNGARAGATTAGRQEI